MYRGLFILHPAPAFGEPPDPYVGSAYKLGELLRMVCHLDVTTADDPELPDLLSAADFAVIRGDRFDQYRLAAAAGLPWVAVAHDLATMRDPGSEAAGSEREFLEGAAAVIFVTGPLHEYAAARYRLPPSVVIPLKPLARDLDFEPLPKKGEKSLVYAGGLCLRHQAGTPWGYRANRDIFAAARRAGWDVHLYPSRVRPALAREYAAVGCVVHQPLPERYLLEELSQYTAGLQVFNTTGVPSAALEYARLAWPNKAWLYQAAGIPTVGCNPGFEAARIYEGRWGVVLPFPDEEHWRALSPEQLPTIDEDVRRAEVIDAYLPELTALMARVTGAPD